MKTADNENPVIAKNYYCIECKKEFTQSHKSLWRLAYYNTSKDKKPLYCMLHKSHDMIDIVREK